LKRILSLFGVLVVLFVTLWFLLYLYERVRFVITDNAYQYADIVDVSTEDVSGYIVELYKREFEAVKRGEPLFKVDDSTLKRELSALNEELKAFNRSLIVSSSSSLSRVRASNKSATRDALATKVFTSSLSKGNNLAIDKTTIRIDSKRTI